MTPKRARCGGLGTTSALRSLFSHAELRIDAKSAVASSAPHPFEPPHASYVRVLPLRHDGECPSDLGRTTLMPRHVRSGQETAGANLSRCRRRRGPAVPETPHTHLIWASRQCRRTCALVPVASAILTILRRPANRPRVSVALALRHRSGAPLARQRSSPSTARPDAAPTSTAAGHPTIRARRRRSTDRCARRPRPWPVAIRNAEPARARARLPKVPELRATSRDASSYPHYRDHTVTRTAPTIVSTSDAQEE